MENLKPIVTRRTMNNLLKKVKEQQIKFPPEMTEKQEKLKKAMEAWDAYGNTMKKGYDKTLYSMMDELREWLMSLGEEEREKAYRTLVERIKEDCERGKDNG